MKRIASHADAQRRAQLAGIHVIANRLRLDDATYRALLQRVCGVNSAADLDARGRGKLLDELRRLTGEGARRTRSNVPPVMPTSQVREELQAMTAKLGAIAAELGLSWGYLDGMARRMFHIDKAEWCTAEQMHKLLAALSIHQKRRRARSAS